MFCWLDKTVNGNKVQYNWLDFIKYINDIETAGKCTILAKNCIIECKDGNPMLVYEELQENIQGSCDIILWNK